MLSTPLNPTHQQRCHSQTENPCYYLEICSWPASSSSCEGDATPGSSPPAQRWGRSGGALSVAGRCTGDNKKPPHRVINQMHYTQSAQMYSEYKILNNTHNVHEPEWHTMKELQSLSHALFSCDTHFLRSANMRPLCLLYVSVCVCLIASNWH